MDLFFTPVNGKTAILNDWTNTKLSYEEAKSVPGNTGVAIVLGLSNVVALDEDDLNWSIKQFFGIGIDITKLLDGHFSIVSPKDNRRKTLFKRPEIELEYIKLPASKNGVKLELRTGNRYDVWYGSEHPDGGYYTQGDTTEIKELPQELIDFWTQCMQRKRHELKNSVGSGIVPLISDNIMSVVHTFNVKNPLEKVLLECGYLRKGKKWKSPHSTSGSYGLTIQPSYLNPWDVCYSHHASDGELSGRPIDAFEIAATFSYPDKDITTAKLIFTAEQSKTLLALDEFGTELGKTVDEFNNPIDKHSLLDLIDTVSSEQKYQVPEFTGDILDLLPEPMPLLLKNFKECIYEPIPAMYGPAFMAIHECLLQSKVRTIRDRSVNCSYANGSLSGGGKDDNSIEAANRYLKEFRSHNLINTTTGCKIISKLLSPLTTTFTSGSNLLMALHKTKLETEDKQPLGAVLMSAEATSFYKTLADEKNQYAGNAILDVEIACFNGQIVSASKVTTDTNKHTEDIVNPNFSFFRLTQLDPFKRAFNISLVEKGYYGRLFETYDISDKKSYSPSAQINDKVFDFNKDGFDFLLFLATKLEIVTENIQVKCNLPEGVINTWDIEVIGDIYEKMDVSLFSGIKRIPQIAEKWVATITAYHYFWLEYKGRSTEHLVLKRNKSGEVTELDGTLFESSVVPMMNYLARVKWYTLNTYILSSDAAEIDFVLEGLWSDCVKLTLPEAKRGATYGNWLRAGLVPLQMFNDKVKKKKEILRITNNDTEKLNRIVNNWFVNKGLKVSKNMEGYFGSKRKTCLVPR